MKKYLLLMAILGSLEITLVGYLTHWRAWWWDSVVAKNVDVFTYGLLIFALVALSLCLIAASVSYCATLAAIEWRKKLDAKFREIYKEEDYD